MGLTPFNVAALAVGVALLGAAVLAAILRARTVRRDIGATDVRLFLIASACGLAGVLVTVSAVVNVTVGEPSCAAC